MLAGEWAVLEEGFPAIILPTTATMKITIAPHEDFFIDFTAMGMGKIKAKWRYDRLKWLRNLTPDQSIKTAFVQQACSVALSYLEEKKVVIQPFSLKTEVFAVEKGVKVGLGGSSASIVAVIRAILGLHKVALTDEQILKMALLANFSAQEGQGSGADIACCVYGKPIVYERFSAPWLQTLHKKKPVQEIIAKKWEGLKVTPFVVHPSLKFLAIFTGESANTRELIANFAVAAKKHKKEVATLFARSKDVVTALVPALTKGKFEDAAKLLKENHAILMRLGDFVPIYTEKLQKAVEIVEQYGGAGKLSGAGGGDCAIALLPQTSDALLKYELMTHELVPLVVL